MACVLYDMFVKTRERLCARTAGPVSKFLRHCHYGCRRESHCVHGKYCGLKTHVEPMLWRDRLSFSMVLWSSILEGFGVPLGRLGSALWKKRGSGKMSEK